MPQTVRLRPAPPINRGKLRAALAYHRIDIRTLARAADVGVTTLSQILNERYKPSRLTALALQRALREMGVADKEYCDEGRNEGDNHAEG